MSSFKGGFFHSNETESDESESEIYESEIYKVEEFDDYDDRDEEVKKIKQITNRMGNMTYLVEEESCSDDESEDYGKSVKGKSGFGVPSDHASSCSTSTPAKPITLQPLHLTSTMTKKELQEFYDTLCISITDPVYIVKSNTLLRVLKMPETVETIHIIYRSHDMYTLGDLGMDGKIRLLDISKEHQMAKVKGALLSVGIPSDKITVVENLKYDYPDLEEVAAKKRSDFKLGRSKLLKYIDYLKNRSNHDNRKKLARAIIFFAQFISESVRITAFKQHIIDNFEGGTDHKGKETPLIFIIYQHSWGPASNCLQRYHHKNVEKCYIRYDTDSEPYQFSDLHKLFGVLKYYGRDYLSRGIAAEKLIMMKNYRTSAKKSEGKM